MFKDVTKSPSTTADEPFCLYVQNAASDIHFLNLINLHTCLTSALVSDTDLSLCGLYPSVFERGGLSTYKPHYSVAISTRTAPLLYFVCDIVDCTCYQCRVQSIR